MTTSIRDKKIEGMQKIKAIYMKTKEEGTIITYKIILDENGKYKFTKCNDTIGINNGKI